MGDTVESVGVQFAIDLFEELIEDLRAGRLEAKDIKIKTVEKGRYEFTVTIPEERQERVS